MNNYETSSTIGSVKVPRTCLNRGGPVFSHRQNPGGPTKGWSDTGREYRFGFNTQEKDNEVAGEGNSFTAVPIAIVRQYDGRLGRRLSLDPLLSKYIDLSAFGLSADSPILFFDSDGEKIDLSNLTPDQTKVYETTLTKLKQSVVFAKLYDQLEKSVTMIVINESTTFGKGACIPTDGDDGKFCDVQVHTDQEFIVAQELFHAYQQIAENSNLYTGQSETDMEAEGEVAIYFIMNQIYEITKDKSDYYEPMGARLNDAETTASSGVPAFKLAKILNHSPVPTEVDINSGKFDCDFQDYKKVFVDLNNDLNTGKDMPNRNRADADRPLSYTNGTSTLGAVGLIKLIQNQ